MTKIGVPRICGRLVVIMCLVACSRYETRPMDPRECPPEPSAGPIRLLPATRPSTLTGTVLDQNHPEAHPIAGARVRLAGADRLVREETSDSAGRFLFEPTPRGRYSVTILRVGYHARSDSVDVPPGGAALEVTLRAHPLDGCPGFALVRTRKPWWKWW